MTLQEIQYKAQSIISKWRDDDSAPYIEFVEELAHMIVPEPSEDLEEAAKEYCPDDAYPFGPDIINKEVRKAFIAGYNLCKDALLKWAKQKQYESLTIVADNFWQEVIDKLNSM